ncbi:MAG: XRE family transcriptional regulator, partial [Halobacteriovoraceae bacterium]|nr:XRE family transcriptional regulator [Halobacteriovoraceae bacterium]
MNKNVLKFVLSLKIRRLRNKKGYSLKDLAEKSGLSHSYLNEIEKGKKYPKVEKLLNLANALDVEVDELVSAKMGKQLHPLLEFLESDLATNLPLSAFGIGEQDIYDLMSHSPEKFTSFLMTVAELAKSYDISIDDLNKSALRAYIEVNGNYFPYLEELASSYARQIKDSLTSHSLEQVILKLIGKLKNQFDVDVDQKTLGSGSRPLGLKSIYREKDQSKVLFINCNLDERQMIYTLVKELGAQQLVSDDSHKKRDPLNAQFGDLLLEFQTHYFAGATLLPETELVEDLKHLFEFGTFSEEHFQAQMDKTLAPPEVFMGRLTQILPHHFEFNQLFWLRCNEDLKKNPGSYFISQELHLGQLHHPHGVSLRERYCRRWITTELLKKLAEEKAPS